MYVCTFLHIFSCIFLHLRCIYITNIGHTSAYMMHIASYVRDKCAHFCVAL